MEAFLLLAVRTPAYEGADRHGFLRASPSRDDSITYSRGFASHAAANYSSYASCAAASGYASYAAANYSGYAST